MAVSVKIRLMVKRTQTTGNYLERFAFRVEGFNRRPLRLCDLYKVCDQVGIEIVEQQMRRLHGSAYEQDGFQFIFINPLISYAEQIIAGYHELFHIFNHVGDGEICLSYGDALRLNKKEFQAQAVGVIALMPRCAVYQMTVEDMMGEFYVSRNIAEFRFRVFRECKR